MQDADTNVQIIARLAAGRPLTRATGGLWRQGRNRLTDKDIQALVKSELLAIEGETARLTELGRSHLERLLAPDTPNRWLVEEGRSGRAKLLRNLHESPLGWLMRRGHITDSQFVAGERLRGDFLAAGRTPAVTMRWQAPTGRCRSGAPARPEPTATQIAARRRFEEACAAAGPGLSGVLERVVCLGEGLEAAERAFGWPARAGKVVLGIALDRLALHYGTGRAGAG